jgi:hypothetical protein
MSLRDDLVEFVNLHVALGDETYDEIVESAVDYMDGEADADEIEALASSLTASALSAHVSDQTTWPSTTDCDRLAAAFAELNDTDIVARENFACCQTCGLAEIGGEVSDAAAARGYAFYHQQDAESAVESGSLHIAYGLFGKPPTPEIGNEVAEVLRRHGLDVYWDGSVTRRIMVRMNWQRRRVGELAVMAV